MSNNKIISATIFKNKKNNNNKWKNHKKNNNMKIQTQLIMERKIKI